MSTSLGSKLLAVRRAGSAAVMGVLNVTPDSFSDGGDFLAPSAARNRVDALLADGADIVDIGGESSRPGAAAIPPREQVERIEPALRYAVGRGALVSIDTTSPEVAERCLELGATLINDVSCLTEPDLAGVVAKAGGDLLIMHARGPMSRMPGFSEWPDDAYADVVLDVAREWSTARDRAMERGLARERIFFDPGLGFAKNARHSFEVLRRLQEFKRLEAPIFVGPGRKSFIAAVDPSPPAERLGGTIAACVISAQKGAHALRVHDVREVRQALAVLGASEDNEVGHA
ncbi:MAG: dihydropteroate synthase [Myxococcales bacterium]|nr:dihydropteroate synthase [Myxococcales bacterium]